jgi:chromosome segregation ATPase
MIKIFLIITGCALLASAVLSYQNREAYIADRKARLKTNTQIDDLLKEFEEKLDPALVTSFELQMKTEGELAQHEADLEQANNDIMKLNSEIGSLNTKMKPIDDEIAEAEQAVETIKAQFPGVTLENVAEKLKKFESDLDDAKQELAAKLAEIDIVSKKVAANQTRIEKAKQVQAERLASITRNALVGSVTAVNEGWGFVVVNIGKDQGVENDAELIVKRGEKRIATLKIVSIQPGLTVADINQKNISGAVEQGDSVIFKNVGE